MRTTAFEPTSEESCSRSHRLLKRACQSLVLGDSSTMRVLPYHLPLVAKRGERSRVWDEDGKEYIDLNMAYGPLLLGHCPPSVVASVTRQISECGSQLGFPTEISTCVAEKIKQLFPSIELLRFTSSGTEACAGAVRLARTVTRRPKIVQFEGHYHGSSDGVFNRYHAPLDQLPRKGYGPAIPGTNGLNGAPHDLVVVRWNDIDTLETCLKEHKGSVAACIMEPVMGNSGVIPPNPQYLRQVRELTKDRDILLIFDEIITGCRVAAGGAQELYDAVPDISVVGKAIGGGYPVSAVGASRELMEPIANGSLFQGGVYSGNAVVMSAANAVLDVILANRRSVYEHLHAISNRLVDGVREIFTRNDVAHLVQNVGPMFSMFLTTRSCDAFHDYRDVRANCDFEKYIRFQHAMQRAGVYFHPNQFEPLFFSTAHSNVDIDEVLDRIDSQVPCCFKTN